LARSAISVRSGVFVRTYPNRLADQLVVLRVGANPKPEQAVRSLYSERSVMQTNSSGPEAPHLLEVEGRMLRISLEQLESFVREFSDAAR